MDRPAPTTVRFRQSTLDRLDVLAKRANHSRSGLIGLAVDAMLDYEARTGKLLLPKTNHKA